MPNAVVEWLTLLLLIRGVLGSNFGLETGRRLIVVFLGTSRHMPG
jgi:hypothetical protein